MIAAAGAGSRHVWAMGQAFRTRNRTDASERLQWQQYQ
jgi:hypothetical protein